MWWSLRHAQSMQRFKEKITFWDDLYSVSVTLFIMNIFSGILVLMYSIKLPLLKEHEMMIMMFLKFPTFLLLPFPGNVGCFLLVTLGPGNRHGRGFWEVWLICFPSCRCGICTWRSLCLLCRPGDAPVGKNLMYRISNRLIILLSERLKS